MQEGAVLVTGAARRIGAAIARALHGAGARVAVHCNRSRVEAERLAAELNAVRAGSCAVVQGDLLDAASLARIVDEAARAFGRLDALVNNLAQAAAPRLREARGAIVNVVDIHAERPLKDFVVYSIAKAGLAGLTRSLALELGPEVRVNGVSPGAILWPDGAAHFDAAEKERITAQTPLARIGSPEDVAGAVKYLLFDAPFVTGQILAVDGGRGIHL